MIDGFNEMQHNFFDITLLINYYLMFFSIRLFRCFYFHQYYGIMNMI
jgi:hypothetical protein